MSYSSAMSTATAPAFRVRSSLAGRTTRVQRHRPSSHGADRLWRHHRRGTDRFSCDTSCDARCEGGCLNEVRSGPSISGSPRRPSWQSSWMCPLETLIACSSLSMGWAGSFADYIGLGWMLAEVGFGNASGSFAAQVSSAADSSIRLCRSTEVERGARSDVVVVRL